ncbi:HCP-like protein, partial [Backusella circina FSU 941]
QHNYAKVMAWSQLSAEKNYSCAQTMIGFLYHKGQGVPINYSIAIEYYLKAARQRDKDAWFHIGYLFECGDGVPVDKYKALEWYSK